MMTPKDTEASTERGLEAVAMNIVYQLGDVLVPTGIEGVKLRQRTNDDNIDFVKRLIKEYAQEVQLETQTQGEQGVKAEASTCPWCKQLFIPRTAEEAMVGGHKQCPPVAPERELRAKLIKAAQDNFDEGDYITDSQDWRRFFDTILTELTHTIEEAVVAELKDFQKEWYGYKDGTIAPKPNSQEDWLGAALYDRINRLEGLQETK